MEIKIKELKNKEIWENFLSGCEEKTFLQSWNWGEFQKMMGNKIWRLKIGEDLMVLVVKIKARRGKFLLIQHLTQGAKLKTHPKLDSFASNGARNYNLKLKILRILFDELKEIAKKENCSFIRVAPLWERSEENIKLFKDLGFRNSPMHASTYEATWKLDITLSEDELLRNMRKTTRYLIRQALKNPKLEVIKSDKIEEAELYDKLNRTVAKHQRFIPFSFEFIKNEFDVFKKDGQTLLFFGKYQEEIIASALIIFWSGIGFYHQAALLPQYHRIPISYLLQWEVIKEAKKRGCKLYDFWGYVNPKENPEHPWAGPTLFKMGFGGYKKEYVKTQDLPLSWKYWPIYLFEKLRKIKRGF